MRVVTATSTSPISRVTYTTRFLASRACLLTVHKNQLLPIPAAPRKSITPPRNGTMWLWSSIETPVANSPYCLLR